jgi:hypothetical protein
MRLQTKVKRYLEYQFKSRKIVHQNHEVMQKLSPFLRIEIQEHMNQQILVHHPFFAGMEQVDRDLFSEVCCLAQSVLYAPGDVVMRKGQLTSSICFIVRGQLQIRDARHGFSVFVKAPAWIGDRGLFVTNIRTHTVICSMHSELLLIRQQDLIDLVNQFPHSESYIKEYCLRVMEDDPDTQFCDFCGQQRHALDECPSLDNAVSDFEERPVVAETLKANMLRSFFHRKGEDAEASTDDVVTSRSSIGFVANRGPFSTAPKDSAKAQAYDAWGH